ncbi:MAG TPA: NlpC/P60 family protein [Terriglobales bacterium]|nr:NlpC/P60 family protein [Terriglobales bacterium]
MLYVKQRDEIVKEAWEWLNTPYRGWSRMKHCGADCIGFVAGVFQNTGHLTAQEADASIPKDYSLQIGQHQADTEYIDGLALFMREIREHEVGAGDVVMFKMANGHAFAHSAIVVKWPLVLHAVAHGGVKAADAFKHPLLIGAARRYFTLKDGR